MQETVRDAGSVPGSGRSPGGGHGNPLQYSPRKFHGQRVLVRYSPWGHKESDTTAHRSSTCISSQGKPNTFWLLTPPDRSAPLFYTSITNEWHQILQTWEQGENGREEWISETKTPQRDNKIKMEISALWTMKTNSVNSHWSWGLTLSDVSLLDFESGGSPVGLESEVTGGLHWAHTFENWLYFN